jgi:putative membrane protein
MSTLKVVGIVIIVFFIISVITSMIRQVIMYFELRFYRTTDGFYISKGLFNKNLIAVKDEKIQSVLIRQNLLRNWVGMFDFGLQKIGDSRQMINVPGMSSDHVSKTIDILYPSFLERKFVFYPISRFYFKRLLFIVLTGTVLLIIIGLILGSYFSLVVIVVASAFIISSFYLKSKKLQFAVDESFVVIMGGKFGTKKKIIPLEKIQTVGYSDSPYQRRKKLKTLHISDGGGTSTVPFIDEDLCVQIREYLIFIMEKSSRTSIHFNPQ